jgi:hypothetical protein
MSQEDLLRGRGRRRALQRPRCREQLVEVGHLAGIVTPCAADRTAALDQEARPLGDVLHPAELVRHTKAPDRVAVPVRQELQLVQVERLAPGGLRPAGIAGDRVRGDSRLLELRSPVTQELELVRSGRRPGEEEEDEERGAARDEVLAADRLARSEPDPCRGNFGSGIEQAQNLIVSTQSTNSPGGFRGACIVGREAYGNGPGSEAAVHTLSENIREAACTGLCSVQALRREEDAGIAHSSCGSCNT